MKKATLVSIVFFLALMPAMVFARGGQAAGGDGYIRFAWWGNATRDERTQNVINLYTQRNPGDN